MVLRTNSPLRYPGGKGKLLNIISEIIYDNSLCGCTYIEPFAGGAGVALGLLYKNIANKVILNDFDRSIYAFWYSILNYTEEFILKIENVEVTIEEWHLQKKIQDNKEQENLFLLGFSTFFLNRTCKDGILKAGPMGGYDQMGTYKIDCRFSKKYLIGKISEIYNHKSKIHIYNMDAIEFMKIINRQKKEVFVYFDPPYYNKGSKLYVNYYKHEEHEKLSKTILNNKKTNINWIVSYDDVKEIKELYNSCNITQFNIRYSTGNKKVGNEIFISNNMLIINSLK